MKGRKYFTDGAIEKAKQVSSAEIAQNGRYVSMANTLIRAGHGVDLSAKRLIGLALSKVDSFRGRGVSAGPLVSRITAQEYAEFAGVSLSLAYRALADAATKLKTAMITFYTPAYRRDGTPIAATRHKVNWCRKTSYQDDEGWVDLFWDPDVEPCLVGLKKHFTSYLLSQTSGLKSTYSWRLLEQFERFKSTGWWQVSIEDFCETMEATEKQRANFNNLRRKMIEPAIAELMAKDGWVIVWEAIKAGRKVTALKFAFKHDEPLLPGI
jgi:plasmid replication initiation protein